jgi:hypothetical protein
MNGEPPKWVAEGALESARQGKKVLAVEGDDDFAVFQKWLPKLVSGIWSDVVELVATDGRGPLLSGLRWFKANEPSLSASVFGLADRDEWTRGEATRLQAELPGLLVNLERHAVESYFCDPAEIALALLAHDSAKYQAAVPLLTQQADHSRLDFIAHWALCRVVTQANECIRKDHRYPNYFQSQIPVPSDSEIQRKLQAWATELDSVVLFARFSRLRHLVDARLDNSNHFRRCIEPGRFFTDVILGGTAGLNRIRQAKPRDWMIDLADWSPNVPSDLVTVLQPVLV